MRLHQAFGNERNASIITEVTPAVPKMHVPGLPRISENSAHAPIGIASAARADLAARMPRRCRYPPAANATTFGRTSRAKSAYFIFTVCVCVPALNTISSSRVSERST